MIDKIYSIQEFIGFMDMVAKKGLINPGTANSRKQATLQILEVLDDQEKQDLRNVDIDSTFTRFANINSARFTPESLKTYKLRFSKGMGDFLSWKENPMSFKPD